MRAVTRAALPLLLLLAAAGVARAWPTGGQFDGDPLEEGGGGGIAFTGAPRWSGHDCAVCHTDAPGQVRLRLEADPADLFTGGYQPGQQYRLRVRLIGEHNALEYLLVGDYCVPTAAQRCDDNGFALEIDDQAGEPLGTFAAATAEGQCGVAPVDAAAYPLAARDGVAEAKAITHSGYHHGLDSWTFCWTAPPAGSGPLTIYVSAVDGNGGDGTNANPDDMQGDDVVTGAVALLEAGGDPPRVQSGGCALAPGHAASASAALAVLLLLVVVVAVGARRRRVLACALLLLGGGCATVHPYQKEKLAQRKMQFEADPDERQLDLHMEEAREGSAGGYGSAGGGCGCN